MKRKRLDRDGWGFSHFPYVQMRVDLPWYHGLACLIHLVSGETCYWHMPRAGKIPVCGAGMVWLQLIPDGAHHALTAKMMADGQVSVWYADMIDRVEFDQDGVAAFVDAYLDVIFSPKGDLQVDDVDELEAALAQGDVTEEQYRCALAESRHVQQLYCADLPATQRWCLEMLQYVCAHKNDRGVLRRNMEMKT